jgi:hypothetical protein
MNFIIMFGVFMVLCLVMTVAFKIGQKKEQGSLPSVDDLKERLLGKKKRRTSKKRC